MKHNYNSRCLLLVIILLPLFLSVSVYAQTNEGSSDVTSPWLVNSVDWDKVTSQPVIATVEVFPVQHDHSPASTASLYEKQFIVSTEASESEYAVEFQLGSYISEMMSPEPSITPSPIFTLVPTLPSSTPTATPTITPTEIDLSVGTISTLRPRSTSMTKPTATRKPTFASFTFLSTKTKVTEEITSTTIAQAVSDSFTATPTHTDTTEETNITSFPTSAPSSTLAVELANTEQATQETDASVTQVAEDNLFHAPMLLKYFTLAFAGVILLIVLGILLFSKKK